MKTNRERTQNIQHRAAEKERKRSIIRKSAIAGASAIFVTAALCTLFVPYQTGGRDISMYKNSDYYPIIEKIVANASDAPYTTNNFKEWFGGWNLKNSGGDLAEMPPMAIPDASAESSGNHAPSNGQYQEVTDNQTDGVIEGDLFKRSDKYIYYLDYDWNYTMGNNYILRVYSIDKENSKEIATFELNPEEGTSFYYYTSPREMYLSEDCNTVTVFFPCYRYAENKGLFTMVARIDVSDLNNIKETARTYLSGNYLSSRKTDGSFLLTSQYSAPYYTDFSDEKNFVPQAGTLADMQVLPYENIAYPDKITTSAYTVICKLDETTLQTQSCVALLSYAQDIYVSESHVYASRFYNSKTDIYQVDYSGEELKLNGTVTVDGKIENRYCMDEYKGVLRVVTSNNDSADLHCFEAKDYKEIASVLKFAPKGEEVKSARFYGDTAYVCTAEVTKYVITDPVFAFDLSDYKNITYTDTGTIPGYSLSLTQFTENTLLGIGYGDSRWELKIEIYRETGSEVLPVTQYVLENTNFSEDHKAHFIDKENGLVGLAIAAWSAKDHKEQKGYLLLHFNGYELITLKTIETEDVYWNETRATLVDGYLYVIGCGNEDERFIVTKIF